jgi:uncharacterized LabA/DUF88 family protein
MLLFGGCYISHFEREQRRTMGDVSGSNGASHDGESPLDRRDRSADRQADRWSPPPESWRDPALGDSQADWPEGRQEGLQEGLQQEGQRSTSGQRVAIFLDGSNLFYAASQLQIEIDYVKLLNFLLQGRRLLRAYFYTGTDPSSDRQQGFLLWMRRHGYRVVTKELVQLADGSKSANLEVEIVIDMITLANHCDAVVLLSGNGNLTYAVNAVSYRGVQVELVSLRSMTSESLINVADRYIDLATIQQQICR